MSFKATVKLKVDTQMPDIPGSVDEETGKPPRLRNRFTDVGEGTVSTRSGIVTISRKLITGAFFELSFAKNDPGIITIRRGGEGSSPVLFVIEENRRHVCLNTSPGGPIEIITTCRKLDNGIMRTGRLAVDYAVELHGFRVEKTVLTLEISKKHTEGN